MQETIQQPHDFTAHMTRFSRVLRQHGFLIGPQETADVVRALDLVDMMDRGRIYWSLRSLLVSRREEIPIYDELFEKFWNFEPIPLRKSVDNDSDIYKGAKEFRKRPSALFVPEHDETSTESLIQVTQRGANAREVTSEKDITAIRADEISDLSKIAARMVRALASRPGRRRKRHKRKGTPDLRSAFRLNLTTGGDIIRLPRLRRVPKVPRMLVLMDVSGSMERHAELLLQLAYAVSQHTKRVETFLFSTSVTRVTRELNVPSFAEALVRVGRSVTHWSGGTRIGESLSQINTQYEHLLSRYTTVFLLSDGWDTGDPEKLGQEIRRMQRRVRSFVWLNPLVGTEDYQPLTRSLQSALPYVDHFVSARNVEQLKKLPQLLRS